LIYRRNNSGSLAIFTAISRALTDFAVCARLAQEAEGAGDPLERSGVQREHA
jgi:hypothetical protein